MGREENRENIAFLVDSSADLSPRLLKGKPIYVAPLRLYRGEKEYLDGETIDNEGVYKLQEKGEMLQTSLPSPERVDRTLDRIVKDGFQRLVVLPLSSGLSGTGAMMRARCGERPELETAVFETYSGSMGIGMVVLELWEEITEGLGWEKLVHERVSFLLEHTFPYFSADTLEYLQKGGRIGKITSVAGKLLNIKPIIGFTDEGELVGVARARGKRRVFEHFTRLLREHLGDDDRPFNLAVANGGDPKGMAELRGALQEEFPGYGQLWETRMDATLAAYVGRGMLGAAVQILE